MDDTHDDSPPFDAKQSTDWSDVAQDWRRRWPTFEQGAQPLSDRLMDLAHVTLDQRVLDVATGVGEPALTAARWVGPGGSVVAIDQAPQMLAVARERTIAVGVTNVEFVAGNVETVSLPLSSFDAVVSRWGLMLFHDLAGTLARIRSWLAPNGWAAAAIWGRPERVPLISLPFSVLSALSSAQGWQPAMPGGPNPFELAEPAKLEQLLRDAGFTHVTSETFVVTLTFASVDDLADHLRAVSAPLRMILPALRPAAQADFWHRLTAAAVRYADADGAVHLSNDCLIVAGQNAVDSGI